MKPQLSDDAAEELIVQYVNSQWEAWVAAGGLDAVEEVLGPVKTEPAHSIFMAGWKLSAEHLLKTGRAVAKNWEQMS